MSFADSAIARIMPWFRDPLEFLGSTQQMERESQSLDRLIQDDEMAALFRFAWGRTVAETFSQFVAELGLNGAGAEPAAT